MAGSWRMNGVANGIVQSIHAFTLSEVDDLYKTLGGKTLIHSILVANNSMAIVKFMRSIRTWALETCGSEKEILLAATATPENLRINAEHIRIANQFVEVPCGTNNNNYANFQLIVKKAKITRGSVVWLGRGHASENLSFQMHLMQRGYYFLGIALTSMAALGEKHFFFDCTSSKSTNPSVEWLTYVNSSG